MPDRWTDDGSDGQDPREVGIADRVGIAGSGSTRVDALDESK
ncbi:MAG: hypothetical protein ABIR12_10190 [Ilumatobacteraceae bacterium]